MTLILCRWTLQRLGYRVGTIGDSNFGVRNRIDYICTVHVLTPQIIISSSFYQQFPLNIIITKSFLINLLEIENIVNLNCLGSIYIYKNSERGIRLKPCWKIKIVLLVEKVKTQQDRFQHACDHMDKKSLSNNLNRYLIRIFYCLHIVLAWPFSFSEFLKLNKIILASSAC